MLRNKFLYWHIELEKLQNKRIPSKQIAEAAGLGATNYTRCEKSGHLPDSAEYIYKLWQFYLPHFPQINMQDLLEESTSE